MRNYWAIYAVALIVYFAAVELFVYAVEPGGAISFVLGIGAALGAWVTARATVTQ